MATHSRKQEALTLVQRLRDSLGGNGGGGQSKPAGYATQLPNYGNRSVHLRQGRVRGDTADPFGGGGSKQSTVATLDSAGSRKLRDDEYKTTQVLDVDTMSTSQSSLIHDPVNSRWQPNVGFGSTLREINNMDDKLEDLDSLKSPRTTARERNSNTRNNQNPSMYQTLMSFNTTGGGHSGPKSFDNDKLVARFVPPPPSAPRFDHDDWRPGTQQSLQCGKISHLSSGSSESKLVIDDDTHALCVASPPNSPQSPTKSATTTAKVAVPWFLLGFLIGLLLMYVISVSTRRSEDGGMLNSTGICTPEMEILLVETYKNDLAQCQKSLVKGSDRGTTRRPRHGTSDDNGDVSGDGDGDGWTNSPSSDIDETVDDPFGNNDTDFTEFEDTERNSSETESEEEDGDGVPGKGHSDDDDDTEESVTVDFLITSGPTTVENTDDDSSLESFSTDSSVTSSRHPHGRRSTRVTTTSHDEDDSDETLSSSPTVTSRTFDNSDEDESPQVASSPTQPTDTGRNRTSRQGKDLEHEDQDEEGTSRQRTTISYEFPTEDGFTRGLNTSSRILITTRRTPDVRESESDESESEEPQEIYPSTSRNPISEPGTNSNRTSVPTRPGESDDSDTDSEELRLSTSPRSTRVTSGHPGDEDDERETTVSSGKPTTVNPKPELSHDDDEANITTTPEKNFSTGKPVLENEEFFATTPLPKTIPSENLIKSDSDEDEDKEENEGTTDSPLETANTLPSTEESTPQRIEIETTRNPNSAEDARDARPPPANSGAGSSGGSRKRKKGWFQRFMEVVRDVINTVTPFDVQSKDDKYLDISVQ